MRIAFAQNASLSDAELVSRLKRSSAASADYRGTIPASERISDFNGAVRAIQAFSAVTRLCLAACHAARLAQDSFVIRRLILHSS